MGEERRLVAILAADMVGYSRLMEADESRTIARQKSHRTELIDPKIAEHKGRIVKTTGDGLLVEFASVVDAVKCAVAIQSEMTEREIDFSDDLRIQYRIGINIGDIVIDGDDIFGEGVNVAARIEGLCEPGEVYLSGSAHEQVNGKIELSFRNLGQQNVKNISRQIQVYRVELRNAENNISKFHIPLDAQNLTDKPSIAVLPFDNMSGDPEQEYFADGITEDLVTALSHIPYFLVIARNTTFTYKNRAVDVQAVAAELGVRYVLEGSIRRAGNRIRVTAQLIDGENGNHIWAERYDRELADIFDIQDEITIRVIGAIEPELNRAEQNRARRKPPENLDAWGLYQQGVWHAWQNTKEQQQKAKKLFRQAIDLDPDFCLANAYLGFSLWRGVPMRLTDTPNEDLADAMKYSKRAVSIDQGNAHAHWAIGMVYMQMRQHDLARRELEKAIEINPSFANAFQYLGWVMVYDREPAEGIRKAQFSRNLSPNDPASWGMILIQAQGYMNMKEFDKAETLARQAKILADTLPINCTILSSSGYTGNTHDAKALFDEVLEIEPDFSVKKIKGVFPFKHKDDLEIWMEGLRRAGIPED